MALGRIRLNRKKSIAISVVALGLMGFIHFSWMKSHNREIAEMKAKLLTAVTELEKNRGLEANLKGRAPSSIEIQSSNDLLERYLKSNEHFSGIVDGIVTSANNKEFQLTKMLAESQVELYGYVQTLYRIEADATFLSIGKFLEDLEDSSLLTEVQSVEIKRTGNEMKVCNAKISLFSYASAEPQLPLKVAPKKEDETGTSATSQSILGNGLFAGLLGDTTSNRVPAAASPAEKKAEESKTEDSVVKKKKRKRVKKPEESEKKEPEKTEGAKS